MAGMRWKYAAVMLAAILLFLFYLAPWKKRMEVIRKGGGGPPTMVLLHGYGSSAEHWIPFTQSIAFPYHGRFLFPQGPEVALRTDGGPTGRAWWPLDLFSFHRSGKVTDLTGENPAGLDQTAHSVIALLEDEGNSVRHPFVLGGFSQGAMVAGQVAFSSKEPLAALILLSGTPINESVWRSGMKVRKNMPVFMAHGRNDRTLSFSMAERLKSEMEMAGLSVTFFPFDGDHEIPEEVVVALNHFLNKLGLAGK
jgi:phospholipase/carboxylesterase